MATSPRHQTLSLMANATFTPTHCPTTGRKFTKAERKAANKAKYAALRAEQAKTAKPKASKPTAKAKPEAPKPTPKVTKAGLMRLTKAELVALILKEDVKPVAKPKAEAPKATAKRTKPSRASKPTPDQRLEARMQRESTRKREAMLAKADERSRKVVSKADGKDAQPLEERVEVYVAPTEHKAKREEKPQLTGLQGLSVEDAIRRDMELRKRAELEAALLADFEGFEDAPF